MFISILLSITATNSHNRKPTEQSLADPEFKIFKRKLSSNNTFDVSVHKGLNNDNKRRLQTDAKGPKLSSKHILSSDSPHAIEVKKGSKNGWWFGTKKTGKGRSPPHSFNGSLTELGGNKGLADISASER